MDLAELFAPSWCFQLKACFVELARDMSPSDVSQGGPLSPRPAVLVLSLLCTVLLQGEVV